MHVACDVFQYLNEILVAKSVARIVFDVLKNVRPLRQSVSHEKHLADDLVVSGPLGVQSHN
jgi:hypothetical protein